MPKGEGAWTRGFVKRGMVFLRGVYTPMYTIGKVGGWEILRNGGGGLGNGGMIFKWGVDTSVTDSSCFETFYLAKRKCDHKCES